MSLCCWCLTLNSHDPPELCDGSGWGGSILAPLRGAPFQHGGNVSTGRCTLEVQGHPRPWSKPVLPRTEDNLGCPLGSQRDPVRQSPITHNGDLHTKAAVVSVLLALQHLPFLPCASWNHLPKKLLLSEEPRLSHLLHFREDAGT